MGSREILTLQFGHYSNYVGTHWWNVQEQGFEYDSSSSSEIDHDVLYREGLTEKNEVTFTPRLLFVDLKGSLKSLPESGNLYAPNFNDPSAEWDPDLVTVKTEPVNNKNQFQQDLDSSACKNIHRNAYDFEKDVSVWSDFLYTRFHPRSVNIIREYQHCNENTPFDVFPLGTSLWKSPQFDDDFCNKIRSYVEECDSFQASDLEIGFHMLTDCTNAFAGLSSSCVEHLKDDYDKSALLIFPVMPSYFPDRVTSVEERYQSLANDSVRVLNMALGFSAFSEHASLFVPLSVGSKGWRKPGPKRQFDLVEYDHELPYHSSALLASALETFSLKYRLKSSHFTLTDLCADLNRNGRRAAAASLKLPFSLNGSADLLDCLDKWQGPLTQSITPSCEIGSENLIQYITLRGIKEEQLKQPPHLAQKQLKLPAYKCDSIASMLNMYLAYSTDFSISNVTAVNKPLNVATPYPRIFQAAAGRQANVSTRAVPEFGQENVPVLAGLHNGPPIGDMLESLYTETKRIKFAKFPQFIAGGMESEEYEECLNTLSTLRENYVDDYVI
ncbi:hypothetical protein NQ318_010021 [Aromia moschata]|uniref:Protein misato n=1 Tax=Aromia moschata TaxID=1265417 RepID=A0AAV8Y8Q9_9CUCU|nr:hypothetical protein NQ318_010021 [Aromia moschata]